MAQIMKYWAILTMVTSYSYDDVPPHFENNYGTQSANFANATYAWSEMPNLLNGINTELPR